MREELTYAEFPMYKLKGTTILFHQTNSYMIELAQVDKRHQITTPQSNVSKKAITISSIAIKRRPTLPQTPASAPQVLSPKRQCATAVSVIPAVAAAQLTPQVQYAATPAAAVALKAGHQLTFNPAAAAAAAQYAATAAVNTHQHHQHHHHTQVAAAAAAAAAAAQQQRIAVAAQHYNSSAAALLNQHLHSVAAASHSLSPAAAAAVAAAAAHQQHVVLQQQAQQQQQQHHHHAQHSLSQQHVYQQQQQQQQSLRQQLQAQQQQQQQQHLIISSASTVSSTPNTGTSLTATAPTANTTTTTATAVSNASVGAQTATAVAALAANSVNETSSHSNTSSASTTPSPAAATAALNTHDNNNNTSVLSSSPISSSSNSNNNNTIITSSSTMENQMALAPLGLSQSMDSVNTASNEEEVRTLFVSGLPMDAKPRELYLLFRAYEGYEGSLLKVTSKNGKTASPVGFVTFHTRAGAEAAKQDLQQGVRFDPDMPQTIRLEFAKSNTKVSKPKPQPNTATTASHPALMHPLTGHLGGPFFPGGPELWHHPLAYSAAAAELPGAAALQHATLVHPALHPQVPVPATGPPGPPPAGHTAHHHFLSSPALASPVGSSNNPAHPSNPPLAANAPCSTLFVANLGQFVSEHELKEVFSSMPGFCRLRMHTKGSHNLTSTSTTTTTTSTITNATNTSTTSTNSNATAIANYHGAGNNNSNSSSNANHPVAFIEFKDTVSAATAMQQLQGKYLLSSDRGSIRIEFAKTKMINDNATGGGSAKHNNNNHNNINNNEALAMQKAANVMNATQLLSANNLTALSPAGTAMTVISNQPPQPQLIILNGYAQQQQQQQQQHQAIQQQVQQQQQQQQAILQTAGVMQQQAILPAQHFITANGGTATAVAYPAAGGGLQAMSAVGPSLATIFTSTNSTNNLNNTTSTTNLNNNNGININNINNNNNNNINSNNSNIVHNRSTALPPPTVVVNSLQHQLHPTQHQNHLFRDRSGYGIKA
ncbi:protein couch potato [Bactrocera dorsalis]|uniref:Protein couch potato n=1 Tax=Bactrocera dorsalis TaxID=27457 RepID=A0ABM3J1B6_BACDO|nr:protein couch potato [Bactrocera dorsalis]